MKERLEKLHIILRQDVLNNPDISGSIFSEYEMYANFVLTFFLMQPMTNESHSYTMLQFLCLHILGDFKVFNLLRYITFRTMGAILTALIISFCLGKPIISWLKSKQKQGQPIRSDGPESHLVTKKGTPTMGGCLILLAVSISTLLWGDLANPFLWIVLLVTLGFGALGAMDDYKKLTRNSHHGISGKTKLLGQTILAIAAACASAYYTDTNLAHSLTLPFFQRCYC